MTETVHYASALAPPPDFSPALENAAVAHCCGVWEFARRPADTDSCSVRYVLGPDPRRRPPPLPYVDTLFFRLFKSLY